jgi:hypothetical protein
MASVKIILRSPLSFAVMSAVLCFALAGCGGDTTTTATIVPPPVTPPPVTPTNPGVGFSGKALAGAQPIVGASVQLYAAGTTGNGSAGSALLTAAITTDTTGAFAVPAGYACPAANSELYVVVRGGKVGVGANNPGIALATVLGGCNQLTSGSQFVINEVTTAATAWGVSQFLGAGGNIGATATNLQGLSNAVVAIQNLADLAKGASPGALFPKNGASPAAKVNSFANLLNTCTAAAASSGCSALFSAATPSGGSAPSDTLDSALNIVRNPGNNVSALYTQSLSATAALSPALTTAPADWTMSISYSGGGMNSPTHIAVDSNGNVWVASFQNAVSEFAANGSPVFANGITGGGIFESYGLAVDAQNNVWVANEQSPSTVNGGLGSVTELNSAGQVISGTNGFTAGGLSYPEAIAIDPNGTVWVADNHDASVTLLSNSGQPLSGTKGYTTPKLAFPVAIAIDASHNGWVANQEDVTVTKVAADGSQFNTYSCCNGASGLAIDQRGYVWAANYFGDSVSQMASDGSVVSSGYSDGRASIWHPQGIAIDGSGHVWVANYLGSSITELAGSAASSPGQILSPKVGYAADAGIRNAFDIQVDASGNLWITNNASNTLTEIIGLATPVKTPQLGPVQAP